MCGLGTYVAVERVYTEQQVSPEGHAEGSLAVVQAACVEAVAASWQEGGGLYHVTSACALVTI